MPQLDPSTFGSKLFWLLVCFGALYLVLSFIVIPRISNTLAARAETLEGNLAEAEKLRGQAETALKAYEDALAEARSREEAEALLAPWLGPAGVPQDLPVPLLVDIRLSAPDRELAERLQSAIDEAGIPALVDDHTLWADRIASGARTAQLLKHHGRLEVCGRFCRVRLDAANVVRGSRVDGRHQLRQLRAELHAHGGGHD